MKLFKVLILCLFILIFLNACSKSKKEKDGMEMIDYNSPKTVCLGRIEVIVPKEAEVEYSNFSYNGSDFKIEPSVRSYNSFKKLIDDRIALYKGQSHETEKNLLSRSVRGPISESNKSISHIIVFRETKYSTELYKILGFLFLNGTTVILESQADTELLDPAINDMFFNLKKIRIKSKNEVSEGLCWRNLFIQDDFNKYRPFFSEVFLKFPSYPNVAVSLNNRVRLESDRPLIEMIRRNQNNFPFNVKMKMNYENIRENVKTVNGLKGEEILTHIHHRANFERGFEVSVWQHLGELKDQKNTFVTFNLESAINPDFDEEFLNSKISKNNIIRLNDFILNSIKFSANNKKYK